MFDPTMIIKYVSDYICNYHYIDHNIKLNSDLVECDIQTYPIFCEEDLSIQCLHICKSLDVDAYLYVHNRNDSTSTRYKDYIKSILLQTAHKLFERHLW